MNSLVAGPDAMWDAMKEFGVFDQTHQPRQEPSGVFGCTKTSGRFVSAVSDDPGTRWPVCVHRNDFEDSLQYDNTGGCNLNPI